MLRVFVGEIPCCTGSCKTVTVKANGLKDARRRIKRATNKDPQELAAAADVNQGVLTHWQAG